MLNNNIEDPHGFQSPLQIKQGTGEEICGKLKSLVPSRGFIYLFIYF